MSQAIPTFFGSTDTPLFGWLHLPNTDDTNDCGIVICNPFGYEYVCTHRTLRAVAAMGAQHGYPTLRFDYEGTGDSAGDEFQTQQVQSWLASIHSAVDYLKRATGVRRVALIGVRLGATLAAYAANDRDDIESIVALAPIVSGRKYVRELRALALASRQQATNDDDDLQEAAGFATTSATRADLAALNLETLGSRLADRVLIMNRDDLPANDAWPRYLQSMGIIAQTEVLHGYVDMMRDAHENEVPTKALQSVFDWLNRADTSSKQKLRSDTAAQAVAQATIKVQHDGSTVVVREELIFTDSSQTQFGIVTEPESATIGKRKQVCILLSSGAVHRPGPNRIYVTLARECAAKGISVLRLDISGIGDSQPRDGEEPNIVYTPRAEQDVAEALEFANKYFGPADIHLGGICSGGYHSLKAATAGHKVSSIIVINPLTFYWLPGMTLEYPEFQVTAEAMRYRRTALQFSSWLKLFRGNVNILAAAAVVLRRLRAIVISIAQNMCRLLHIKLPNDLGTELQQLARQDVGMFFIFAATDPGYGMLREKSGIALSRLLSRKKLSTTIIEGADHTFTPKHSRDKIVSVIVSQLTRNAPIN